MAQFNLADTWVIAGLEAYDNLSAIQW